MLKHTALVDAHKKRNAKLIDFGGWEMPLHYGSQIEEHHRVRRDAGMFDVSHMLAIDLTGKDAKALLRVVLANNVDRLVMPGQALYSCMLNSRAGVIDDLIVYFVKEASYRLVVNAGTADKDVEWISQQRDHSGLELTISPRRDLSMIAVQGPNAREKFWQATPALQDATKGISRFCAATDGDWMIARTGYTGEDGFEIMLPATEANQLWDSLLNSDVAPAGLGARDTLRLEAGMNLYGQDMDENVTPTESGLGWTVDIKTSREFIGKAALLDLPQERKLVGLVLLERGVLRAHQKVQSESGEGEITSGSYSPTLGMSIGFARMSVTAKVAQNVSVVVRDRGLKARTVKYPFVRNGLNLISDQLA